MAKKKKKKKNFIGPLILILLLILAVLLVVLIFTTLKEPKKESGTSSPSETALPEEEPEIFTGLAGISAEKQASILEYGTYGVWLQWNGSFPKEEGKTVDSLSLCWQKETGTEETFLPVTTQTLHFSEEEDDVHFCISEDINNGVFLDRLDLPDGAYSLLLRVRYAGEEEGDAGEEEVLSFSDSSGLSPVEYYTMTKNGKNRRIRILPAEHEGTPYFSFTVEEAELPEDVYDIVLDPGHGGKDLGAVNGSVFERDLALQVAEDLKADLESEGYKVFMTRDGTESDEVNFARTMYDPDGRVNTSCASKGKVLFCIHYNSFKEDTSVGGVEIYCSSKADTHFAELLANDVTEDAGTHFSTKEQCKVAPGVYVRTFTEAEIAQEEADAENVGLESYPRDTDTDYYFMLREYGERWTGAYVDGRGEKYGANEFRNENAGLESILLELGYISNEADLKNIMTNREGYVSGILRAFHEWLGEDDAA